MGTPSFQLKKTGPMPHAMELFAVIEDLAAAQARWAHESGAARLNSLVLLAWHLRQHDCAQALALADEAQSMMDHGEPASPLLQARLWLVRAEVKSLFADLDGAWTLLLQAMQCFESQGDARGAGDAHWLAASVCAERGSGPDIDTHLACAQAHYRRSGDTLRCQAVQARGLIFAAFRDPVATAIELRQRFALDQPLNDTLATWVLAAYASVAALTDDPGAAVRLDLETYQAARRIGQLRRALVSACNASESFTLLGDLDAALEWAERSLGLARQTGWPASISQCLVQWGDVLRLLQRHTEARACLQEALDLMSPQSGSRTYELALGNLAQLDLDVGDTAAALAAFDQLEARVRAHDEPDLRIKAWRGQASALAQLGNIQAASDKALAALALAQRHANLEAQVQVLQVLAALHRHAQLPPPQPLMAASAELHFLQRALEIAATIQGYGIAPELFQQLAAAQARCGDYRSAYDHALAADNARVKSRRSEAQNRVLAMQIRHDMEVAQAQAEQHRRLAATLSETTATLETLGIIGRDLTASLEAGAVFAALHRHVNELLDATSFAVYLLDPGEQSLSTAFGMEAGQPWPQRTVALDSAASKFAACARTCQELVVNLDANDSDTDPVPGTMRTLSHLFMPLMVHQRLLGVMSIQSPQAHAYGERERSILRTLCAYGAIALDNAAAYSTAALAQRRADLALSDLRETQAQLIEQNRQLERLSVTDQLTGLFNRLQLDRSLDEERARALRYSTQFCVVLLDLDRFKSVNDTFGHPVGDQVLVGLSRVLQRHVREADVLGRWGGEEFLIVCRDTTLPGARVLAEKLRVAIAAQTFAVAGPRTASFGVAAYCPDEAVTDTLKRADEALYQAKLAGRNRVMLAGSAAEPQDE